MAKSDPTKAKIQEEIAKLEQRINEDKIRLDTLKSLIAEKNKDVPEKPKDFTLTKVIRNILGENRDKYLTPDSILEEIAKKWDGYKPRKNSVDATLSAWRKEGKVNRNEMGGYMLTQTE